MIRHIVRAALASSLLLFTAPVTRAADPMPMGDDMPGMASGDTGASSQAFRAANARMHRGMDIPFTGDTDADFVHGMVPHHQGAVEMAKVELAHGKDPELRKLAESIIADQEREIAFMTKWLAAHGK